MKDKKTAATISEASKLLGVSRPTVYKWLADGLLYKIEVMGLPYIPYSEIDRLNAINGRPKKK